jgi:hypothetical protein
MHTDKSGFNAAIGAAGAQEAATVQGRSVFICVHLCFYLLTIRAAGPRLLMVFSWDGAEAHREKQHCASREAPEIAGYRQWDDQTAAPENLRDPPWILRVLRGEIRQAKQHHQ